MIAIQLAQATFTSASYFLEITLDELEAWMLSAQKAGEKDG